MLYTIKDFLNRILSVFSTFRFSDFLDIVLVAVIIYICVRIIRETRAMQLIKGIVFLACVYIVVSLLHMEASTYMFESIFSNILLLIAVIFAPELRSILESIGKGTTRKSLKAIIHPEVAVGLAAVEEGIEAVIKACSNMSDDKTGALIVFENQTLLGDVIDSGTIINAKPTRALIESIFFPKTPLHDGAMVVRDGKVYAAGCILPLTKKDVKSSYGTRHRAAIGLSEESDAVIVVVSEETGAISVARGGSIISDISDGDLRDILMNTFIPNDSSSYDKIFARLVRRKKK